MLAGIVLCPPSVQGSIADREDNQLSGTTLNIEKAINFGKAMGWNTDGKYEQRFVQHGLRSSLLEVHNEDYAVDFDESTGQIRRVSNNRFYRSKHQLRVAIDKNTANKKAIGYLQAAGIPLDNIELYDSRSAQYSQDSYQWYVRFRRVYDGYPYYFSGILVILNPEDASLIGFGCNLSALKPLSTDVKVDKAAAVECARTYMAEMGYDISVPTFAELLIVQPDDYWEYIGTGDIAEPQDIAQLAWVLRFNAPWDVTEVWVDAENGNVLGGSRSKSMPVKGSISSPFASTAQVECMPQVGRPLAAKIVKGDLCKAVVSQISNLKRTDAAKCNFSARIKVDCGSRSYTYGYSPANHLLVLLEKSYKGKAYKAKSAFKTTAEIEQLLSLCAGA